MLVIFVDKKDNIVGDLNLILLNIPDNISLLEKIRWVYKKVGMLFSYDYRVGENLDYALKEIDFRNNYVSRYQTCLQISYLFDLMLKQIDPSIQTKIIERKLDIRGHYNDLEHQANEVVLPNGEKYILDLTLDLYLIQSGCQTLHFGYETDAYSTYDIIPTTEIEKIDEKLGLKDLEYKDVIIKRVCRELDSKDLSGMSDIEILNLRINAINSLMVRFNGYLEGKQYINKLFHDILGLTYKEFNLTYNNNDDLEMVTCFVIPLGNEEKWYIYNNKLGLVSTDINNISNMLRHGWGTKSNTLNDIVSSYHK